MQRLEFRAMNCQMLAVVAQDDAAASAALARFPAQFAEWESCLSRFRADSELSQLNRQAGLPVPVSDTLWAVIDTALEAAEKSEGLVTPTLLNALEAIGYDRTFEALGADQPAGPVTERPAPDAWRAIQRETRSRMVTLPPALRLDLGGMAKGWAADQAAAQLGQHGPALVEAGGDIAISAPPADLPGWPLGVADPFHPGELLEQLCVAQGGVATSGRDYRRWRQQGAWQHHILDPRTGHAAETDVISVTVIAPTAREAEMAAKVALIWGSRAGLNWIEERPHLAGLLVGEDGLALHSRHFLDYLWR